jgi:hypothetical protein
MSSGRKVALVVSVVLAAVLIVAVLSNLESPDADVPTRDEAIPADATKMTPGSDTYLPVIHSDEWLTPVPMPGPVNTAGAEDSPFITPDGNRFFFFFTPDVRVQPEGQLLDKVTGIWWCAKVDGSWTEPEKMLLCDDVALDGAEFVSGNTIWFASVRAGNYGEIDIYTATYEAGEWGDVENAGEQLNVDYDIGEFHIAPDGETLYFHTGEWSTGGNMDLWTTVRTDTGWSTPVEVPDVNTEANEGYPFITPDGNELWYTGESRLGLGYTGPAIFRCVRDGDGWGEAVEIISNFAGECTIDELGNIYFVHHYFSPDMTMIEADIYVAYKAPTPATASGSADESSDKSSPIETLARDDYVD